MRYQQTSRVESTAGGTGSGGKNRYVTGHVVRPTTETETETETVVRYGVSWSGPDDAGELTSYELADGTQEDKGEEKGGVVGS